MQRIWLLLHLIGSIVWLGGMFTMLFAVRPAVIQSLKEPRVRLEFLESATGRFLRVVWVVMPLTLLSGFAMMIAAGIKNMPPGVHAMTTIGLIMSIVFLVVWFGPYKRFQSELAKGNVANAGNAHESLRKLVLTNLALGILAVILVVVR
jgi:uncharacterized membrane protein